MRPTRATMRTAAVLAAAATLAFTSPATADNCDKDKPNGNAQCDDDKDKDNPGNGWGWRERLPSIPINEPSPAATPELGSLALFGTGVASAGGYVLLRLRARRRPD